MPYRFLLISFLSLLTMSSCATKKIKNISYTSSEKLENPTLNVFVPRKVSVESKDILIFVYGGNWNSGKKEIYSIVGRNFAKRDIITVIPDYTLSPNASYDDMAKEIAKAISWTHDNVARYNGNPQRIFITGHSAGGHLAALSTMSPEYSQNLIKGIILNDAAGLDMYSYLKQYPPTSQDNYDVTWTTNPDDWKKASPLYFLDKNTPPILSYLGKKTYPSIIAGNKTFQDSLKTVQPKTELISLNKKHVPMVTQYFFPWSKRYKEIVNFMDAN